MNSKIKIVITATEGMLGRACFDYLSKNPHFEVTAANRLRDKDGIGRGRIELDWSREYDFCVNCVGVVKPLINENDKDSIYNAIEGNVIFPNELARCRNIKRVLSIATDCVYSGLITDEWTKGKPFYESDKHDGLDVYSKTKSLGEIKQDNWHNLRVSIIGVENGNNKRSLLNWFLSQPKNAEVNGFINNYWNGITCNEFAKICERIILNKIELPNLTHIVPYQQVTKAELLGVFQKTFRPDMHVNCVESKETIYRVLGTNNPSLNEKLIGCKELSIVQMIEDLRPYVGERIITSTTSRQA